MGLEERRQTKEIGGVTYQVTPVPFGVGRVALVRLLKIVSPVLSEAFKQSSNQAMAAGVLSVLPSSLSDDDISYYAKLFGPYSEFMNGSEWIKLTDAQQDLHFAGKYYEFLEWLLFAISVNYAPFFSGILKGGAGGGLLRTMAPTTQG